MLNADCFTGGDGANGTALPDDEARDERKDFLCPIDGPEENIGRWDGDRNMSVLHAVPLLTSRIC